MKKKQKIKLLQTCRTFLPPRPMQQRGPVAHWDVLVGLGFSVLVLKWNQLITIANTLTRKYPNTFPSPYPSALALQSPSGAGAASAAGFGLCDFGSFFLKKVEKTFQKNHQKIGYSNNSIKKQFSKQHT